MTKSYLVIDVGGTNIKYGIMTDQGQLTNTGKKPTPPKSLDDFLASIFAIIDEFKQDISGVAFSVPGKVDTKTGTVYFGGALVYLDGLCFKDVIGQRYGLPVAVQNDAKAAALAELWLGNLQGVSDGAAIVLSTGVGGGIVLDGKLRMGAHFQAGELSLSVLDTKAEGVEKITGVVGSAVAMIARVNESLGNEDSQDGLAAFEAIKAGHAKAVAIFEDYCLQIAYLILNLQAFYDLTTYVIGGGISAQAILIDEIKKQYKSFVGSLPVLDMTMPKIDIVPAKFGNDANLYGALYQLLQDLSD